MAGPSTDPRGTATGPAPKRRGTELALLIFALVITLAAQCIVDLTVTGSLRPELAAFGIHLLVRREDRLHCVEVERWLAACHLRPGGVLRRFDEARLRPLDLTREIPEAAKPRRIEISSVASQPKQIEAQTL